MFKQRLYLPFNYLDIVERYDTAKGQFGIKISGSSNKLFASGKGRIYSTGNDFMGGKFISVVYEDIATTTDEYLGGILIRYCHLNKIYIKKSKKVTFETCLGTVLPNSSAKHPYLLYLEADKDLKHPNHTPTLTTPKGDLLVGIRGDNDTTIDPLLFFNTKKI